ncbi:hypothetical protein [Leekyejoonella antrihumi]|uniref:Site-specific integrase n=1 Tax=Leekyejoonella antrihumi TaxID=1660198 RepID=A0A563DTP2_9MICO|nr:hypothetical protein [Leekyejoonella antrihumi]TWP33054.1 hypothetical protein FGL98_22470 [Leekyejoonella antrihumi]
MPRTTAGGRPTSARDTLALLLGFTVALRRSEEASLTIGPSGAGASYRGRPTGAARPIQDRPIRRGGAAVLGIPFGTTSLTCVPCARPRWLRPLAAPKQSDAMTWVLNTPADPAYWAHVCSESSLALDPVVPLLRRLDKFGRIDHARAISGSECHAQTPPGRGRLPLTTLRLALPARGMVTQARRNGAPTRAVRRQARHSSDAMVDVYDRDWNPLNGSAVLDLGL